MKNLRFSLIAVAIISILFTLNACKAKKPVVQLPSPAAVVSPAMATPTPAPAPTAAPEPATPAPAPPKPDYNFSNIQFEFNSGVLKTSAYPILDKAAVEMKKDPSAKFIINGYASAEGTDEHNMALSADRANAVKIYLVNSGIPGSSMTTKGYGEANPVADNTTEAGKVLNRRVELKVVK